MLLHLLVLLFSLLPLWSFPFMVVATLVVPLASFAVVPFPTTDPLHSCCCFLGVDLMCSSLMVAPGPLPLAASTWLLNASRNLHLDLRLHPTSSAAPQCSSNNKSVVVPMISPLLRMRLGGLSLNFGDGEPSNLRSLGVDFLASSSLLQPSCSA